MPKYDFIGIYLIPNIYQYFVCVATFGNAAPKQIIHLAGHLSNMENPGGFNDRLNFFWLS